MKSPFSRKLLSWYKRNARDLPWRHTRDPYRIWISEIMLQQTTVAAVIPYYQRWFTSFPSLRNLAKAPLNKVLKLWQGLGYYQRARNLQKAAQMICQRHSGKIPETTAELLALPGMGPYTSAAVASIAFNVVSPVIDANVRRVVMRLCAIKGKRSALSDRKILAFLSKNIPADFAGDFNQAMMELGALICRSADPNCPSCPVKDFCLAFAQNLQHSIPETTKKNIETVHAVVALIQHHNRFLIQQRPSGGLLGNLWEFPGGKIEHGESPDAALRREIREELGCRVTQASNLFKVTHFYTHFRVILDVWACKILSKYPRGPRQRWATLKEIETYPLPAGTVKIINRLKNNHNQS